MRDAGVDSGVQDSGAQDSGVQDSAIQPDTALDSSEAPDAAPGDTSTDPTGPTPAEPPPAPEVGDRIEIVSVTVRTGTNTNAETDAPVELCLADGLCSRLNVVDVNDRENGNTEVYHLEVDLPVGAIDRVTLRTPDDDPDNDRWTPACVDIRVDGAPLHCNDAIPVHIGTGDSAGEVVSWTDPRGVHQACTSCWGGALTHGPLIGPPGPTSVRVWARADATRLTGLRLGTTRDLRDAPVVAWAWPRAEDDFTVDLVAEGLAPDTEYFYRVEVGDDTTQPVRSLRTAPEATQALPTRLAFGSCTRQVEQPIFTPILATRPDLFLFIGDNNYANSRDRDALRWHYRRFRGVRERGELVANTPTLAIWDDHDFLANNSNGTCPGRADALGAFEEYWANPAHGLPEAPGVFFNYRWGAAELFLLDCRMHRPDVGDGGRTCEPEANPPDLPREGGPLGAVQERWLVERLSASDAVFKLVACGSRFTPAGSLDSWAAFPEASARLTEAIADQQVGGVVFLSGDIHRSALATVPGITNDVPEITSSPLANSNSTCNPDAAGQIACFDDGNSFVLIDIDPTLPDPTLTASVRDESGAQVVEMVIRRSELE